jgi:hypothetical protein
MTRPNKRWMRKQNLSLYCFCDSTYEVKSEAETSKHGGTITTVRALAWSQIDRSYTIWYSTRVRKDYRHSASECEVQVTSISRHHVTNKKTSHTTITMNIDPSPYHISLVFTG